MAIRDVPGTYATVGEAAAAAEPGDTIVVAAGYARRETVSIWSDKLIFDAPSTVTGITLRLDGDVTKVTLRGHAPINVESLGSDTTIIGNNGANRLSGNARKGIIDGGGGDDIITASGSSVNLLKGGTGNDTFIVDGVFSHSRKPGTIDGGSGRDTVRANGFGDYRFTGIEVLDVPKVDVRGRSGANEIEASAEQLSSFGRIIDSSSDATTFRVWLHGPGRIDFSQKVDATDAVHVSGGGSYFPLDVKGTSRADVLIGTMSEDRLDGGAGNDTIIASAYDSESTTVAILIGGEGDDTFIVEAVGGSRIYGGVGTDTLESEHLGQGTFRDVEILDSRSIVGSVAQFSAFDRIVDSDSKTPHISLTLIGKGGSLDLSDLIDIDTRVSVDSWEATSGVRITGTSGDDSLRDSRHNDVLDGGEGNDSLSAANGGFDTLKGGTGNDRFHVSPDGGGRIDGGAGTDTVIARDLGTFTFADVEVLSSTAQFDLKITLDQLSAFRQIRNSDKSDSYIGLELQGEGGTLDLSKTSFHAASVRVDATALTSALTVKGTSKAESLVGTGQGDVLNGAGGSDWLVGGKGRDVLTGGSGDDSFVFSDKLGSSTVDRITDFSAGGDRIVLNRDIFVDVADGYFGWDYQRGLRESAFQDLADSPLLDAQDRILYDRSTGSLFYDADGSGAKARVLFAVLDTKVALTYEDFSVIL